jgi:acetolactate synthase-1/2/3 large subunit
MKNMPIYQALAQAFVAEGVDTHFTLMGDGNMHWAAAMKNLDGMSSFFARHEHCACAMAMGYHLATGKVGVAYIKGEIAKWGRVTREAGIQPE